MNELTDEQCSERLAFLQRRQLGIGGSDLPLILGLSQYGNALDVYYSKTREIKAEDVESNTIHQLRGHAFEDMAMDHYMLKTGRDCVDSEGPTRHPDYPNVVVSLDFEILPDDTREEGKRGEGVGETKSPISKVFGNVIDHGLRQSELIQLQTNIAVAQLEWGSFCYFNMEHKDGPVIAVDQLADHAMGKFLLEAGQRFWDEHVAKRIPPVPSEWKLLEDDDAPTIYHVDGELQVIDDDPDFRDAVGRALDRKDLAKVGKEQYSDSKQELLDYLGERGIKKAQLPGLARISVVDKKGTVTLDKATLANALPLDRDAVERYMMRRFIDAPDADPFTQADVASILACVLDLKLFEKVGNPSQYVLPNRSAK